MEVTSKPNDQSVFIESVGCRLRLLGQQPLEIDRCDEWSAQSLRYHSSSVGAASKPGAPKRISPIQAPGVAELVAAEGEAELGQLHTGGTETKAHTVQAVGILEQTPDVESVFGCCLSEHRFCNGGDIGVIGAVVLDGEEGDLGCMGIPSRMEVKLEDLGAGVGAMEVVDPVMGTPDIVPEGGQAEGVSLPGKGADGVGDPERVGQHPTGVGDAVDAVGSVE
jgi:hypothetical protein